MKDERKGLLIGGPKDDRHWWFTDETCFEAKPVGSLNELDVILFAAGLERAEKWEQDDYFPEVDGWYLKRIQS